MAWLIALAVFLLPPLLFAAGRSYERRLLRQWDRALSKDAAVLYARRQEEIRDEWEMADILCRRAGELRKAGSIQEALRILDTGLDLIAN